MGRRTERCTFELYLGRHKSLGPTRTAWSRRSSVGPQLVPRSISKPPPGPLDTQPSDVMTHQHRRCAVAPSRISNDEDDNEAPCGKHLMPGPCTTWNHVDNLCCVSSG